MCVTEPHVDAGETAQRLSRRGLFSLKKWKGNERTDEEKDFCCGALGIVPRVHGMYGA